MIKCHYKNWLRYVHPKPEVSVSGETPHPTVLTFLTLFEDA